jgi:hypothetical protein
LGRKRAKNVQQQVFTGGEPPDFSGRGAVPLRWQECEVHVWLSERGVQLSSVYNKSLTLNLIPCVSSCSKTQGKTCFALSSIPTSIFERLILAANSEGRVSNSASMEAGGPNSAVVPFPKEHKPEFRLQARAWI